MQQLKIEQIAYHVVDINKAKEHFKKTLGLTTWVDDIVVAKGTIQGLPEQMNKAHLTFNHETGIELELICYLEGNNWHSMQGRIHNSESNESMTFPSHLGMHVTLNEMDQWQRQMASLGIIIVQEVRTISHTNKALIDLKQHYHYIVFDSRRRLGFDLKLIRRI